MLRNIKFNIQIFCIFIHKVIDPFMQKYYCMPIKTKRIKIKEE